MVNGLYHKVRKAEQNYRTINGANLIVEDSKATKAQSGNFSRVQKKYFIPHHLPNLT